MYRKRLRSPAGCIRCKSRHSKCDEKRPRCSFCTRHNLNCTWPTPSQIQQREISPVATPASCELSLLAREPARTSDAPCFDPFHTMPVHYSEDSGLIIDHLHGFFLGMAQTNLPFDVANTHHELTRGWLASVYSDEVVCTSFVTYCSWFYTKRTKRDCNLITLSLKNEAHSLALLRDRMAKDELVTEGTLLAAALHLFIAIFSTEDTAQLFCIAQGIYALVSAKGGSNAIMRIVSPSTMHTLILVDIFNSLLSTQKPYFENIGNLPRPSSYESLLTPSPVDGAIAACLGTEVTAVLQDVRFALFFRTPSQQKRKLSSEESQYLFMLLQKINYAICTQQSRLASSRCIAEIAIYGMVLVKEEVLSDVVQHPILPITFLQRLRHAISTYEPPLQGPCLTVALWASMMALVGTEFEVERIWALDFITEVLLKRYGQSWPQDWHGELRRELQWILWHDRIEVAFKMVCTRICHLRSHITNQLLGLQNDQPVRGRPITT